MAKVDFLKERAESFLENAKDLIKKEEYPLAAFNLEQAAQLSLKYYLFLKIRRYPKIHLLGELLKGIGKVYIFGSILEKKGVPGDIDVLIISPKLKTTTQKSSARAKILQKIGFSVPFELHLISPKEYKDWYKFFIEEKVEI